MLSNKTILKLLLAAPLAMSLAGCEEFRGFPTEKPPIHIVQDMDFQPKLRAQSKHEFEGWHDNRGARKPVGDPFGNVLVVARGSLPDSKYASRDANGQLVTQNPLPLDHVFTVRGKPMSAIDRGQECYTIHCAVCHGASGQGGNGDEGHGIVGRQWKAPPPNFHFNPKEGADNRVPNMPDGEYFEVITNGVRTMPAYGTRMSVEDRWAIVHYVRALQSLSR